MDISDKSGCSEDEGSIDILLDEDDDIDDDIVLHKSESYLKAPLHDIDKLTTKLKQRSGSLRGGRTRVEDTNTTMRNTGGMRQPLSFHSKISWEVKKMQPK